MTYERNSFLFAKYYFPLISKFNATRNVYVAIEVTGEY
jgi:hypothetical protein